MGMNRILNAWPITLITGLGSNVLTALQTAVGSAGGPVVFNGAGGTPSSLTLTNALGLPKGGGGTGATTGQGAATNLSMPWCPLVTVVNATTASQSEVVMSYVQIAGGVMGSIGKLELDTYWTVSASNGTWTPTIRIVTGTVSGTTGGTALFSSAQSAGLKARSSFLICNTASNAQSLHNTGNTFTATSNTPGTAAIDTASAFTVSINGKTASASDTLSLVAVQAILWPSVGGN